MSACFMESNKGLTETTDKVMQVVPEAETGNIEYKYRLIDLSDKQFIHLSNQLKYRINQDIDSSEAVYKLGITDDGYAIGLTTLELNESLNSLTKIAGIAGTMICNINKKQIIGINSEESVSLRTKMQITETDEPRYTADVTIRKLTEDGYLECRVAIVGNVDAGKSSLLGVLTSGSLDNGRGSARLSVFNFKHEIENGRTSSVSQKIMGFNDKGENVIENSIKKLSWEDIVGLSNKIITFYDLAGHECYLHTTISGLTSNRPDYVLIVVGSNMGIQKMTLEHLNICLSFRIPLLIIFTKIDLAPTDVLNTNLAEIQKLLKRNDKQPLLINNETDLLNNAMNLYNIRSNNLVPILKVSNVTGQGLNNLKKILYDLPLGKNYQSLKDNPVKCQIQECFNVKGTGLVIGGLLLSGTIRVGDEYNLGPTNTGEFITVHARSIECKRIKVHEAVAGKFICVNLPGIKSKDMRKGMFLLSTDISCKTVWEFDAKIYIERGKSVSITKGYQPHCHIGHISQSCQILDIRDIQYSRKKLEFIQKQSSNTIGNDSSKESVHDEKVNEELSSDKRNKFLNTIGAGDTATVTMRFCYHPEVIFNEDKQRIIFREGITRGIGLIISVNPDVKYESLQKKKRDHLHNKKKIHKSIKQVQVNDGTSK